MAWNAARYHKFPTLFHPLLHKRIFVGIAGQHFKGPLRMLARTDEDVSELGRIYELARAHTEPTTTSRFLGLA